jgi:hypothetical protein
MYDNWAFKRIGEDLEKIEKARGVQGKKRLAERVFIV